MQPAKSRCASTRAKSSAELARRHRFGHPLSPPSRARGASSFMLRHPLPVIPCAVQHSSCCAADTGSCDILSRSRVADPGSAPHHSVSPRSRSRAPRRLSDAAEHPGRRDVEGVVIFAFSYHFPPYASSRARGGVFNPAPKDHARTHRLAPLRHERSGRGSNPDRRHLHVAPQTRDLATTHTACVLPIPDQHRITLFRPGRAHALLAA